MPLLIFILTLYVAPKLEKKFTFQRLIKSVKVQPKLDSGLSPKTEPTVSRTPTRVSPRNYGDKSFVVSLILKHFGSDATIAIAVAMAESGLRCEAIGDGHLDPKSYGVFQIRAFKGRPPIEKLLDCEENIKHARQMQLKQGWKPWSAFTNKSYLKFL